MFTIRAFRIYFASVGRATLLRGEGRGRRGRWRGGARGKRGGMDDETFVSKEARYRSRGNDIPACSSASSSSRRHVATDSKETVSRRKQNFSSGTVPFEIFARPWARYAKESKSDCVPFLFHLYTMIFSKRESIFVVIIKIYSNKD